jgi:hypothetical protein
MILSAANANDATMLDAVLDDIPATLMPTGHRRRRPGKVHADKAYDHRRGRGYLTRRRIKVRIARGGIESSVRLGRHRWKAERSIACWLGAGDCVSATTAALSAPSPSPCWPACG